jgi:uncharacterized BrkB/YihY/UPF0761 family membrane protein
VLWLFVIARLIIAGSFLNASFSYRRHPEALPREEPLF